MITAFKKHQTPDQPLMNTFCNCIFPCLRRHNINHTLTVDLVRLNLRFEIKVISELRVLRCGWVAQQRSGVNTHLRPARLVPNIT